MTAHDHGHPGHDHRHADVDDPFHSHVHTTNRTRLLAALVLIVAFMVVEVVVGILAGSVALLADAGHMLVDGGAIALALVAVAYSTRPAEGNWTFGWKRLEILAAQINGLTLVVLAGGILFESIRRLFGTPEVAGGAVLVVAALGAVVNLAAMWILSGADRRSLNVEGAYQHVLMDLLGSVAAIAAGLAIVVTGFDRADAIAAMIVALLMLRSAWRLVRASTRVLLQASPEGLAADDVGRAMAQVEGIAEVHDLHLWEVTSGFPTLSAHIVVARDRDCHAVRRDVEARLSERFGITHSTLQTDHVAPRLHRVGRDEAPGDVGLDGV